MPSASLISSSVAMLGLAEPCSMLTSILLADARALGQLVQGPAPAVPSWPGLAADGPGDTVAPARASNF